MTKERRNRIWWRVAALAADLVFYLAFPLHDGPVWCKDSLSYTTMECAREPLYPLFLMLLRERFGDGALPYGQPLYLFAAALIQSAVAAAAVFYAACVFSDMGRNRKQRGLLFAGTTLAFWGVQLLCRFAALRRSAYPESILTESLALSFWLLFFVSACRWYQAHRVRDLVLTALWMFLCMSLRKQLLVSVLVMAAAGFLLELIRRHRWQRFVAVLAACVIALAGSELFDYGYNYKLRGIWMHHTGNAMGIDCALLYTTTADDADLFKDEDSRRLFLEIQQQMEEQHLRYVDNPEGTTWSVLAGHYADAYDVIGYEIMNRVMDAYVLEKNPGMEAGSPEYYLAIDKAEVKLRNGLLHQNPSRYLRLWAFNFVKGLVNTILRMNPVLIAASAALYLIYLILLLRRPNLLSGMVLLAILINAVVVGAVIFPQTRYMIYNMGLFYASLWLMLTRRAPSRPGIG